MNIKSTLLGSLAIIIFLGICALIFYMAFYENTTYYTQIDNTKITKIDDLDTPYQYTLTSYTEAGKEKDISFKTVRELRDTAYLKITYMITRGVINWEEVTYDELPDKVKSKYERNS